MVQTFSGDLVVTGGGTKKDEREAFRSGTPFAAHVLFRISTLAATAGAVCWKPTLAWVYPQEAIQ